jgi:hypothetical protein
MLRFLADENFDGRLTEALLEREPALDVVRVQDVGLMKIPDRVILEWAAGEGRVLLTHDIKTMPFFAFERVRAGLPMAGVAAVRKTAATPARLVEDLLTLALIGTDDDVRDQVVNVPLR